MRAIAVAMFLVLFAQTNADAAVAVGSQVDTASPGSLFSRVLNWAKDAPKPPPGPQQRSGTAGGRDSRVGADATRAGDGNGRPRVVPKGELGPFDARSRERKSFKTGYGMQPGNGFDARTAKRRGDLDNAYTQTSEDAGGRLQQKITPGRLNFKRPDGSFAAIDTGLRKDGTRYRQKANNLQIDVAASSDDPAFTHLGVDDTHGVSASMAGAAASPAVVDGDTARYVNAFRSIDVELLSLENGIKETFVLKGADAPTRFVFPLTLTGLTARLSEDGNVEFVDADGNVAAVTPRGFMVDSKIGPSGEGATSDNVTYRLITRAGAPALEVTLDRDWVRDPARVLPIRVDPTVTKTVTGDTFADKFTPTANRATATTLAMGTYDNGTHLARAYFKFNALNPPAGQHTVSAFLNLFMTYTSTCTPTQFDVYGINDAWNPTTLTWNNAPSLSSSIGSLTPAPGAACTNPSNVETTGTWVQVPVLRSVIDFWGYQGLAVKAPTNTGTASWKRFDSMESPAAYRPFLSVTYAPNVAPQVDALYPEPGASVYSLRPELMAEAHDPDTYPQVDLRYEFRLYNENGVQIATSGTLPYGVRTWVPPGLAWNKLYGWTAGVNDGELSSPPGPISYFTPTVPQPLVTSTLGQNDGQGFDPNVANYTTSETDAEVSTFGPPLAVARNYNSRDPRVAGAFGAGWSSIYDLKVTENREAVAGLTGAVISYPEGVEVGFGRNPDGTWAPPLGRFATLTTTGADPANPSTYKLIDKNGTTYEFEQSLGSGIFGITRIKDARGFTETFHYTGSAPNAVMDYVQSASGRRLNFLWQPAGTGGAKAPHITTVTTDRADPANPLSAQVWTYRYTGDRLDAVCPTGTLTACTGYNYQDGSGYSTTVLDAGPRTYLRLREAAPTMGLPVGPVVTDDVLNNQGAFSGVISGATLNTAGGPLQSAGTTVASFDGNDSIIQPWDVANNAAAQSIGLWFKAGASGAGGVLYGHHSTTGLPGTVGAATYSPALYIDANGFLRGQFYSGGPSVPIKSTSTVTNNAWHFAVLTVEGGTQKLYVDGAQVGASLTGQPAQAIPRANTTIGTGYLGGLWPDQSHYSGSNYTGYLSPFTGQIAEVADFAATLTPAEVGGMWAASQRTSSLLDVLKTPEDATRAGVEYDRGAATVRAVTDANGGRWELQAPTITGSSTGFRTAVILSSPTAYWRFADSAGTQAYDDFNYNYGNYDNVTLGATGPFGAGDVTAASFNGTTSQMRSPVDVAGGANSLSISMWFKTQPGASTGRVLYEYSTDAVTAGASTGGGFVPALYIGSDGRLQGNLYTASGGFMVTPGVVNNGAWHHVVLAGSGTQQRLYLDGAQVAQATTANPIFLAGPLKNTIGAGYLGGGWPNQPHGATLPAPATFFDGQIAEVAVYSGELAAARVTAQWDAYRNAATLNPVKYVGVKHPTGEVTTNAFDPRHYDRIVRVVNTLNFATDYEYDTAGYTLKITDANGNTTFTGHDERGNVSSYTTCQDRFFTELDPIECSTEYFRYHLNTANPLTDPINDRIKSRKDGRTLNAVDDNRFLTSYGYTPFGDLETVTTPPVPDYPSGRTSTTTYVGQAVAAPYGGGIQPARLVASTKTPGNATQQFIYYSNGDLAETISPLGGNTRFEYDGLGRVIKKSVITASQPNPVVTEYSYDGRDQVQTQTGPARVNAVTGITHQARTTYTYDDDGNITDELTEDIGPANPDDRNPARALHWTYYASGQVKDYTDARGKITHFVYNLYGQKTFETAPDGQVTESTYDSEGRAWRTILHDYTGNPNDPTPAIDLVLESRAYDPAGRLASVSDPMGYTSTYTYFDNNLPAALTRRDTLTPACLVPSPPSSCSFVVETNAYDPASNLISRTINGGKTTTRFAVDAAGRVASETLELGTNTANDASDRTVAYTYDADDNITATLTTQGSQTPENVTAEYDLAGNLTKQAVQVGATTRTTLWGRDDRGLVTSMTDPKTKQTTYINDVAGDQVQIQAPQVSIEPGDGTAALGRPTTTIGYDMFGQVTETRDPNNQVTRTAYDEVGNVASITAPSYTPPGGAEIVATTSRFYNDLGQLERERDPLEHDTTYVYDQLGDLVRTTAPGGAVTTFAYTTNGNLASAVSPTGAVTESTYDFLGRKITDAAKLRVPARTDITKYLYGPGGWLATQISPAAIAADCTDTCPQGEVTKYEYDNAGQVASIIDGAGKKTEFTYDLKDRQISRVLADGTSSTATFNAAGDLTGTAERNSSGTVLRTTSASYDANGWLTSATDARGQQSTFIRDDSGLITSQTEPVATGGGPGSTITSTFGYDGAGNPTRFTDGRGNAFLTTYTPWNLPATRVEPSTTAHPNASDRTWTWSYDAGARPVSMGAPGGVERVRDFDDRGNLLQESGTGAEAGTATRTFEYDLDNRLTKTSAPGTDDTFVWDDRSQLRSTGGASSSGGSGIASFDYDADGRMTSRTDAAGTSTYAYANGRLATISDAATGTTASYEYYPDSQVKTVASSSGPVRTYTYDALQRLETDTVNAAAGGTERTKITYGYDENDNLTSKTTSGVAGASANLYTYDFANRLTSYDNGSGAPGAVTDYAYDAAGNRTQVGNQTLIYDQRNRLTAKTGGTDPTTYLYSPRGTRVSTAVTAGSSTVTTASAFNAFDQLITTGDTVNAYDGLGRVVTTGPSAGPAATLAYTGMSNDIASDGTNTYARDPAGDLVAIAQAAAGGGSTPGTGALALTDLHDDLIATLNPATAAVIGSRGYDPLGKVTATTGTLAGRLGYQSELTDPATGAVNMLSRWFDPNSGQFISRDGMIVDPTPASAAGNGYGYLEGNPFAGTDPSGHCCGLPKFSLPKIPNPLPAITSTISAVYTNVIKPVVNTAITAVKQTVGAVVSGAQNLGSAAKALAEKAATAAKAAAQKIADEYAAAKERAIAAAAAAKRKAIEVAERVRKEAVHMAKVIAKYERQSRKLAAKIANYGVAISQTAGAAIGESIKLQLAAVTATVRFVDTHKATLAGIAVGAVVTGACLGGSGGLGSVGCFAAGGAAGSAVTAAISHPPTSLANVGQILEHAAFGAAIGVATLGAGKFLGPIAKSAVAPALTRFGAKAATRPAALVVDRVVPAIAQQEDDLARAAAQKAAAEPEVGGGGQVFTHFTDADGVAGIAGAGPLKVGESVGVNSLKFGQGSNNFLATNPGDNFVTDLGLNASPGQLQAIGVFGAKQEYAIRFSQEAAFNSGVRPVMVRESIFTIPGPCSISGACVVTRVR